MSPEGEVSSVVVPLQNMSPSSGSGINGDAAVAVGKTSSNTNSPKKGLSRFKRAVGKQIVINNSLSPDGDRQVRHMDVGGGKL